MENNTEKLLEDISKKLNALLSLNLRILVKDQNFDVKNKRRRGAGGLVNYFADFNLNPKDIAAILDMPTQSVRTLLTPKRRKR
ncbi:hypothetical protein HZB04_00680 [Candidatus Wolfebacteria bacterium]|nr:hypothetical protein [Candidatus Wolfebacteria bacterium]